LSLAIKPSSVPSTSSRTREASPPRTDKTARNYRAGILLAATLIWIKTN
jgi:hypothetical protein